MAPADAAAFIAALPAAASAPAIEWWAGRPLKPAPGRARLVLHALVPFGAGLAAALIASALGAAVWQSALAALGVSALCANALLDLRTGQLSDLLTLLAGAGALGTGPGVFGAIDRAGQLYGGGFAAVILILAALLVRWRKPGTAPLGAGDIGLAAAGGLFVGEAGVGWALAGGAVATLPFAVMRRSAVPFGPGLAAGFLAVAAFAAAQGGRL